MTAQERMLEERDRIMQAQRCSEGIAMSLLAKRKPELLEAARAEATQNARHPSLRQAA